MVVSGWVVAKCLFFPPISCMREPKSKANHTPGQIVSHAVEMESLRCVKLMYLEGNKMSDSWVYSATNFSETFLAKNFYQADASLTMVETP